jgi:Ca-activated chloride channel family protein
MLLAWPAAGAQSGRKPTPNSRPQDQDEVLKLRTDEVLLNITVIDPYGHLAPDLNRSEFIIAEDGQRQEIASFLVSSVPVNVVLLLDASGSVVTEIEGLRDAAMQFVNQLGAEDKVSIIEFHTKLELIQDWTSKPEEVRHALQWRFKPGMVMNKKGYYEYGSTALFDAVYSAADEQLAKVEGRKAIIILTDGDDTSSKVTREQALGALIKAGAVVYVVSKARAMITSLAKYRGKSARIFAGPQAHQAEAIAARLENAEKLMAELSARTGGQLFSPVEDKDLSAAYAQAARELKNQYIITYVSRNGTRDGRLRRVNVFLTRPGFTSRTRDSYYAPKENVP